MIQVKLENEATIKSVGAALFADDTLGITEMVNGVRFSRVQLSERDGVVTLQSVNPNEEVPTAARAMLIEAAKKKKEKPSSSPRARGTHDL